MRLYSTAAIAALALSLAACDPHAPDSPGPATPPADAPVEAAVPLAPPPAAFDGDFRLVGTEPFWGVSIKGDQMVLDRPDQPNVVAPRPAPVIAAGVAVWKSEPLAVTLKPADCSDGMSDRTYAYEATVTLGEVTLKGCGDRPEALAAQKP